MLKLRGTRIELAVLEKEHCRILWEAMEHDFDRPTEPLHIGHSIEKADDWFAEIQRLQDDRNIRLGIFLSNGEVIGDIALQDIDWRNRCCSMGMGIQRLAHRSRGYGTEAIALMLRHAFHELGLHRVWADTLDINIGAQRSLLKAGFALEGRARQAVFCAGQYRDRLQYGILREEYARHMQSPDDATSAPQR